MTTVIVLPDSATIFAAACACIFTVVGVAGKHLIYTKANTRILNFNENKINLFCLHKCNVYAVHKMKVF